jgi:hypothetical protein
MQSYYESPVLLQLLGGTVHVEVAYARDAAFVSDPPQAIDPALHMQEIPAHPIGAIDNHDFRVENVSNVSQCRSRRLTSIFFST